MKQTKGIILCLAFFSILGGFASAQEKEKAKDAYEKARVVYEEAKKAIYDKAWPKAITDLEKIAKEYSTSGYYGESLYWLGYSLDKHAASLENMELQLEKRKEAIERLNQLLEKMPENSWARDARILQIRIAETLARSGLSEYQKYINGAAFGGVLGGIEGGVLGGVEGGVEGGVLGGVQGGVAFSQKRPPDPDLELKLVALDALLQMDKEKAFPILEKMVKDEKRPELREKALMVLGQSRDARILPLLTELAVSDPSPRVQEMAVMWLSQRHDEASLDALLKIYEKAVDSKLKARLFYGFAQSNNPKAQAKLIEIAKNDKDLKARERALFWIGQKGAMTFWISSWICITKPKMPSSKSRSSFPSLKTTVPRPSRL